MAINAYIQFSDVDGSNPKKYRVAQGSYKPVRRKIQNRRRSITGVACTQEGPVTLGWAFNIFVRETESESGYGTLANLRTLFERNDPSGSTSGRIRFYEFDDTNYHTVELVGEMSEDNWVPVLTGSSAWFTIPIALEKT